MTKILQIDREAAKRLDQNAERAGLIMDPHLLFPEIAAEHLASHREQATRELVEACEAFVAYNDRSDDLDDVATMLAYGKAIAFARSALTKANPDA